MKNNNEWDLNRFPSKKERMLGIILAALIFLFFSFTMYLSEESSDKSLVSVFVALVLFFGSLILFVRVTFSKIRKSTKRAIRNTGYVLFSLSCAMIFLPLFVGFSPQAVYMIAIGFIGLRGSKVLLNRGDSSESS